MKKWLLTNTSKCEHCATVQLSEPSTKEIIIKDHYINLD